MPPSSSSRRDFLKQGGTLAAIGTAGRATAADPAPALPQLKLGKHSVSRLICGANPFNAGSHLSTFFNQELKSYYTDEQVVKTLRRCEEVGINAWQSTVGDLGRHRRLLDSGGKMQFLALDQGEPASVQKLVAGGAIGIAHHGEFTDRMFKAGNIEKIGDILKRFKDAGVLAGISTHMPAVVDAVESKGWDFDYYMTCIYERHRTEAELIKLLGQAPIPVGEVYLPLDPPRMFKMIQQTKRVCLAFKILAAGRLSDRPQWVERAFRETYASIKPGDGVIIGMYDRFSDQPAQNAEFVRRFGAAG
jgi:hypothetical protein